MRICDYIVANKEFNEVKIISVNVRDERKERRLFYNKLLCRVDPSFSWGEAEMTWWWERTMRSRCYWIFILNNNKVKMWVSYQSVAEEIMTKKRRKTVKLLWSMTRLLRSLIRINKCWSEFEKRKECLTIVID